MAKLENFENVLNSLGQEFDSHDFIKKYVEMFPAEYLERLFDVSKQNNGVLNVTTVNGQIASNFLTNCTNIKKCGTRISKNILENESSCTLWQKI